MSVLDGLVLLKPTSIAFSGTSATVGANGSVSFTACTSLSLNGVFTSDYDNYMVVIRSLGSGFAGAQMRLRSSGVDASGSNYTIQVLVPSGSLVFGARDVSQPQANFHAVSNTQRSGGVAFLYGPFLAQPTAVRNVNVCGNLNAEIYDYASTHSLSTSYDGFSLIVSGSQNMTGMLCVYGLRD